MNKNYLVLTALMMILAFGTFFLAKPGEKKQADPQQLLREIVQPTRYLSTDEVARMIIKNDPSLELIDVRSEEEFNTFSLPRSVNVPLDSLLSSNYTGFFGIQGTKVVFISTDDIEADQAWVLTKRLGYTSTYVMRGGINQWFGTIIQPQEPTEDESFAEIELYQFRKGAQQFFTGGSTQPQEVAKVKVDVVRQKKTSKTAGGC